MCGSQNKKKRALKNNFELFAISKKGRLSWRDLACKARARMKLKNKMGKDSVDFSTAQAKMNAVAKADERQTKIHITKLNQSKNFNGK